MNNAQDGLKIVFACLVVGGIVMGLSLLFEFLRGGRNREVYGSILRKAGGWTAFAAVFMWINAMIPNNWLLPLCGIVPHGPRSIILDGSADNNEGTVFLASMVGAGIKAAAMFGLAWLARQAILRVRLGGFKKRVS